LFDEYGQYLQLNALGLGVCDFSLYVPSKLKQLVIKSFIASIALFILTLPLAGLNS
jgi:hypothetical protein